MRQGKQVVWFGGILSAEIYISTDIPHEFVLSPDLYTLYRNDLTRYDNAIFVKYSDDTEIVDVENSIPHYLAEVDIHMMVPR